MRLKTLPLMIWLLLLLTLNGFAQTPPESPDGQGNAYGIEPGRLYPGTLVLELMEMAEAEIDAAVGEAYAEGYKAASLRFVPEMAVQNQIIEAHKKDHRNYRRNVFITAGVTLLCGMAVGTIIVRR
jgi:hypothetical protein